MDLNYVLIWLAGFSGGGLLLRCLAHPRLRRSGWLVVSLLLVLTLGVLLLVAPALAGYVSGSIWALLILAPMLLARQVNRQISGQRFDAAARTARLVMLLHPADGWRDQPRVLHAMALMRQGRGEEAVALLERFGKQNTSLGWYARLQLMRTDNRWSELLSWVDAHPQCVAILRNPGCFGLYLRALGEQGRVHEMLDTARRVLPSTPNPMGANKTVLMMLSALSGRPAIVEHLFDGHAAADHTDPLMRYWLATAHATAGETEVAQALLVGLDETDDALQRAAVQHRMSAPPAVVSNEAMSPENREFLDALERELRVLLERGTLARPASLYQKRPIATWVILLLLLGVFVAEIPGGTTHPANLVRLGALVGPAEYLKGEYWRVITAGFLHFGWLHLTLNVGGLWYFGRFLERALGVGRYLIIYLFTSIGAFSLIVLASGWTGSKPFVMVGASASLMGLVGASVVLIWRGWRKTRSRVLRQQLVILLLLFALQTTFDLMTPAVSFAAHCGGALIGLVLALTMTHGTSKPGALNS